MNKDGLNFALDMFLPLFLALVMTALFTWKLIPFLKRVRSTQSIHEDVPDSHHKKSGTPTMGGLAIIAGLIVGSALYMALTGFSQTLLVTLAVTALFGLVGFIDDYHKVINKRNLGLRAKQKMVLQIALGLAIAIYYVYIADMGTEIVIPFAWKSVDIGLFIIPYIVFIVVAMVNSVNLTDGLDGLAGGITAIVCMFYPLLIIIGVSLSVHSVIGAYSDIIPGTALLLDSASDGGYFTSLAGACLGFLIFNRNPAKIFMGDTGSLALGGGIAVAAIFAHMELLLPIAGLVFVLEALSDIIQVGYFKLTHGKRVFKMAPLHHHFELSGWKETKVVAVFTGFTLCLCVLLLAIMLVQIV
jgi:phospho-N-acetylmuramoyl-pentapeptide-transferase